MVSGLLWTVLVGCVGDVELAVTDRVPVVEILQPVADSRFWPGDPILFCASIADEDDPETWDLQLQSSVLGVLSTTFEMFDGCPGGDYGTVLRLEEGDHTISFSVTDSRGQTGQDEVRVLGAPNSAPTCAIGEPDDGDIVRADLPTAFEALVSDEETESADLVVTLESSIDGMLWSGNPTSSGDVRIDLNDLSGGLHLLSLGVADAQGLTERCTVPLNVDACPDDDGDGYETCDPDLDCDDGAAVTFPGAIEIPDRADNDCDGVVDEGTIFADDDGDGFTEIDGDCDDLNATAYPEAPEVWYDGIDANCDFWSDFDADRDGFDAISHPDGLDCDDTKASVRPGIPEIWYDGVDQDCDGVSDFDRDGDGYDASAYDGMDCDDNNVAASPDAVEARDGIDNDCDEYCDEGFIGAGNLIISEIMYDSSAISDSTGEWFEVYNPTAIDIALCKGWSISDFSSSEMFHHLSGSARLVVRAASHFVFGRGADGAMGLPDGLPDYSYYGPLALGNGGDRVSMYFTPPGGSRILIDTVDYRGSEWPSMPAGGGRALALRIGEVGYYSAEQNDAAEHWCVASNPFFTGGVGDFGTPGELNDCP